ncbi:MAG: Lambda phage tail tube protein [Phycisphaerales bacterium]|nr:Lambda phage tail tube protein [Phycisphaerales bacterium]
MAYKSQGTTISADADVIARVITIKPPQRKADAIETTTLDSEKEERMPGLEDRDTCSVTIEYSPAKATQIAALFNVEKTYTITFPNSGGSIAWKGFISQEGVAELKKNDRITQEITITASGTEAEEEEEGGGGA